MTANARAKAPAVRQAPAGVDIVSARLRSTNLERDVRAARLGPVHIGVRAQDMLERVASALDDPSRTRAWSLTGPYGSGKSTLALVTTSLLGRDVSRRAEAEKVLGEASPTLAHHFASARDRLAPDGFITCVTTARGEPLLDTVVRALREGVAHGFGNGKLPVSVAVAVAAFNSPGYANQDVLDVVRAMCAHAPVMLVIDEFGKSLEHLAARGEFPGTGDDVFLLQELAELGAGSRGLPLFLLTLQHLSFADYASRTTALQTREWAKIQGRFEDVLMTTHLGDAVDLIRRTLTQHGVSAQGRRLIAAHAAASRDAWISHGLDGILPADAELFGDLYPLHPLTTVVAPLLAAQIGQHDRSMTGFIANDEPHTVRRFLASYETDSPTVASTVKLADVFDFFFTAGRTTILASANASRWMEIDNRLTQANGQPEEDRVILKTIGMLNLVDSSGALRASMDTIRFALCDPTMINDEVVRQRVAERINDLVAAGFIVYREFSDEYRVWQGSDVDLTAHIEQLIAACDDHAAVAVVSSYLPTAVVAGAHSQRTGMLRHFITRATDVGSPTVIGPSLSDAADGILVFHLGGYETIPAVQSERPVIVGVTSEVPSVLSAARYVHALQELPDNVELDSVASHEVSERLAQAKAELATRVAEAFLPTRTSTTWNLLATDTNGIARWSSPEDGRLTGRSLAALVSQACEIVFPKAPHIRNEMLGRHTLTSQGAKARRELMLAMINAPTKQYLGIDGYGPERAMYSGVLEFLGLHGPTDRGDGDSLLAFGYKEPAVNSSLNAAWVAMREQLQAATGQPIRLNLVFDRLEAPPFGVRPGVIPIIVLTALILGGQEFALFEDGTYQTRLTEALVERLLKNPERFAVKAMGTQAGLRKAVINEIAQELGIRVPVIPPQSARNVAPLAVTRDLLDRARTLSSYADRTQQLSARARAVRVALKTAREPDTLLFNDLPIALGLDPIPAKGRTDEAATRSYASSLKSALTEIAGADRRLRTHVIDAIADAFHLPAKLPTLRTQLAALTRHLVDVSLVEARLRGVIDLTQDTSLTDDEWVDPFVVRIVNRGLSEWRDGDITTFTNEVRAVARAIERLAHLHQAPTREPGDDTFSTRVVTLTRPDGREDHTVIHVSDTDYATARTITADIVATVRKQLGRHGERILLALLAETVLAEGDTNTDTTVNQRKKPNR